MCSKPTQEIPLAWPNETQSMSSQFKLKQRGCCLCRVLYSICSIQLGRTDGRSTHTRKRNKSRATNKTIRDLVTRTSANSNTALESLLTFRAKACEGGD